MNKKVFCNNFETVSKKPISKKMKTCQKDCELSEKYKNV